MPIIPCRRDHLRQSSEQALFIAVLPYVEQCGRLPIETIAAALKISPTTLRVRLGDLVDLGVLVRSARDTYSKGEAA